MGQSGDFLRAPSECPALVRQFLVGKWAKIEPVNPRPAFGKTPVAKACGGRLEGYEKMNLLEIPMVDC